MGDSKSATCAELEGESCKIGREGLLFNTANLKSLQHSLGSCHKRPQEDSLLGIVFSLDKLVITLSGKASACLTIS